MNIIILAAGQGMRLGSLSEDVPKFLIEYRGIPIFQRLLENLKMVKGDFNITVVLGVKGRCWNQKQIDLYYKIISENKRSINVCRTIINYDNDVTNNSYSLKLALDSMSINDTLIIDGDIIFNDLKILQEVINQEECIVGKLDEGMPAIKIDKNNIIKEMSRDYKTNLRNAGILKLSFKTVGELYNILKDEKYKYQEIIYPLNELFKKVKIKALINNDTININTFEDLKGCKEKRCFLNDIYYNNSDKAVELRLELGRELARQDKYFYTYDYVVPVMESGLHFACGFAEESKFPIINAIERKAVVGRTLYENNRELLFDKKYLIHGNLLDKKKIVLIDEAIFSGKTINYLIDKIKEVSNPEELHIRIITPIITKYCEILPKDIIKYYEEITSKVDSIRFLEDDVFNNIMKDYCKDCL